MAQVTFLLQEGQSRFPEEDADRLKPEGRACGTGSLSWLEPVRAQGQSSIQRWHSLLGSDSGIANVYCPSVRVWPQGRHAGPFTGGKPRPRQPGSPWQGGESHPGPPEPRPCARSITPHCLPGRGGGLGPPERFVLSHLHASWPPASCDPFRPRTPCKPRS